MNSFDCANSMEGDKVLLFMKLLVSLEIIDAVKTWDIANSLENSKSSDFSNSELDWVNKLDLEKNLLMLKTYLTLLIQTIVKIHSNLWKLKFANKDVIEWNY